MTYVYKNSPHYYWYNIVDDILVIIHNMCIDLNKLL